MNLLCEHDIQFDHDDNLLNWDQECPWGVSVPNHPRSLQEKHYSMDKTAVSIQDSEWQRSCFGFHYYKGVSFKKLSSGGGARTLTQIKQLWKKYKEKPWSWEGAPEFKDWSFHGIQPTEVALLRSVSVRVS